MRYLNVMFSPRRRKSPDRRAAERMSGRRVGWEGDLGPGSARGAAGPSGARPRRRGRPSQGPRRSCGGASRRPGAAGRDAAGGGARHAPRAEEARARAGRLLHARAARGLALRPARCRGAVSRPAARGRPGDRPPLGAGARIQRRADEPESECEPDALRLWNGAGAVRLLEYDEPTRSLLLERCFPGERLWDDAWSRFSAGA